MNPVDDFLSYDSELQKEAMAPAVKNAIITGAIGAGTLALGTIATGAAQDVLDMARSAVTRSMDFRRMVKENPEVSKLDRAKTQTYFNTLHRFSPEMAADPTVAASWVKRMGEFDYVDPATVQQLVSTSERMRSAKNQQRIPPFQLAQAAMQMGMEAHKEQRATITPAQKAVLDAQSAGNLLGIREKAKLEGESRSAEQASRTALALQQAVHAGRMKEWEAGLPRSVGSNTQFMQPPPAPPPPEPKF